MQFPFKKCLQQTPLILFISTFYIQAYAIKTQPWASENKALPDFNFFLLQLGYESQVSGLASPDPLKSLSLKETPKTNFKTESLCPLLTQQCGQYLLS